MKQKRRTREKHYFKDPRKPATRARIERKARKHRTRRERGDARHQNVLPRVIATKATQEEN